METYRFEIPRADKTFSAIDVMHLFDWLDIHAFKIEEFKEQAPDGDFLRYVIDTECTRRSARLKSFMEDNGSSEITFQGVVWLVK